MSPLIVSLTWQKEDSGDPDQLEDGHLRVLEAGPLVDHLHDAAGQQPEVWARRPHLRPVWNKDGASEVADHAGAQVDDGDALGARHLLQVPHQPELEGHRDREVNNPGNNSISGYTLSTIWFSVNNQIRFGS